MRSGVQVLCVWVGAATIAHAQVEAVWLTSQCGTPERTVVSWKSARPGPSVVAYGADATCASAATADETGVVHHVEIPTPVRGGTVFYRAETGAQKSETLSFQTCPESGVRVAVVGDWGYANRPDLTGLKADRPHVLVTAGDNVGHIVSKSRPGDKANIEPFVGLVRSEQALFAATLFMPTLGNHDKQVGERGKLRPAPGAAVYDVDAAAYLQMFALPAPGWRWAFSVPQADALFLSLDIEHVSDLGTGWQTCHDYRAGSDQYRWYDEQTSRTRAAYVVTLLNERSSCRALEKGAWGRMFERGTLAITGFGYFAERAVETNGFSYYNTCVAKPGDTYRDAKSAVFESCANYMLLTFGGEKDGLTVELKRMDGTVIDRQSYARRK